MFRKNRDRHHLLWLSFQICQYRDLDPELGWNSDMNIGSQKRVYEGDRPGQFLPAKPAPSPPPEVEAEGEGEEEEVEEGEEDEEEE